MRKYLTILILGLLVLTGFGILVNAGEILANKTIVAQDTSTSRYFISGRVAAFPLYFIPLKDVYVVGFNYDTNDVSIDITDENGDFCLGGDLYQGLTPGDYYVSFYLKGYTPETRFVDYFESGDPNFNNIGTIYLRYSGYGANSQTSTPTNNGWFYYNIRQNSK